MCRNISLSFPTLTAGSKSASMLYLLQYLIMCKKCLLHICQNSTKTVLVFVCRQQLLPWPQTVQKLISTFTILAGSTFALKVCILLSIACPLAILLVIFYEISKSNPYPSCSFFILYCSYYFKIFELHHCRRQICVFRIRKRDQF